MRDTDEQTIQTQDAAETPEAREPVPRGAATPGDGALGEEQQADDGTQPDGRQDAGRGEATDSRAEPAERASEGEPEGDALEQDVDELLQAVAKRDEYLALAQRTQADFENYRKRVAREATKSERRGVAKLAKELLPALDNLDRALEAAAAEDPLLQGVGLVRNELHAALGRQGIEAFSPVGEPFDPSLHEAVAQQPIEGAASGSVAEVYQAGYRLGDEVIRPARVLVAA